MIRFAGTERTVASAILIANGIAFGIMTFVFTTIGELARGVADLRLVCRLLFLEQIHSDRRYWWVSTRHRSSQWCAGRPSSVSSVSQRLHNGRVLWLYTCWASSHTVSLSYSMLPSSLDLLETHQRQRKRGSSWMRVPSRSRIMKKLRCWSVTGSVRSRRPTPTVRDVCNAVTSYADDRGLSPHSCS